MKADIPKPVHETYLTHRKEVRWKIIAPVAVAVLLCVACSVLINVATFSYGGDVARWAEISTIYLAIPTIIFLVIIFALVGGMVYLLTRLLAILPNYTYRAQGLFYRIKTAVRHAADAVAKPVITIDSIGASINRIFSKH
jgi:uncharacterized membrane protein YhdT